MLISLHTCAYFWWKRVIKSLHSAGDYHGNQTRSLADQDSRKQDSEDTGFHFTYVVPEGKREWGRHMGKWGWWFPSLRKSSQTVLPQGPWGCCRKVRDGPGRGQIKGGKSHTPCCSRMPLAGASFAGCHEKRGFELAGAQDQEPWLEYYSALHLCHRTHLYAS